MLSNLSSADAVSGVGKVKAAAAGGFVSRAIMIENFRRFWPIGLLAFIVYFVSGPLPMLLRALAIDSNAAAAASGDINVHMGLSVGMDAFSGIIFAIVAAIAVFRYTHSPSSLAVVHAFPVGRAVLFRSNLLSGFMLFIVPYVISALLSVPIMSYCAHYMADHYSAYIDVSAWPLVIGANIVIMLYTYVVTVLAGMVSGNTPVHLMTAAIFNFAWIFICLFGTMVAERFLVGLSLLNNVESVIKYLHPFMYYLVDMDSAAASVVGQVAMMFVYIAVSALIVAIAWRLYRSFKAERAGDSITYRAVEYIFVCVVAIAGLFLGGELLGDSGIYDVVSLRAGYGSMDYVDTNYIIGAFIGAGVAFVIATMILRKSARVFDIRLLRRFGAFAVATAVFFVCVMTNITGFETRVPAASGISAGAFSSYGDLNAMPPYKRGTGLFHTVFIPIKGEDGLRALEEFHHRILDERAYVRDAGGVVYDYDGSYLSIGDVYITYALKGGMSESRKYTLSSDFISGSDAFARLIASDSVKEYMSIGNMLGYDALDTPELYYLWPDGNSQVVSLDTEVREMLTGDALKEFAACLDEDYRAMGAEDMLHPGAELFTLHLSSKRAEGVMYESADAAMSGKGEPIHQFMKRYNYEETYSLDYTVTEKSVKAIAWLKDAGVYDSLIRSMEELKNKDPNTTNVASIY
ncbi:MAG: hypothetical protein LBJ91_01210 [Clostridiales Family XIII bacterium]|jgi:hypothetical protein|nr:hypothetical protein [Clostridiales Family XIII bacterium]